RKRAFGRPVHVVRAPAAVPRDRSNYGEASVATLFKVGSEKRENGGGADEVDVQLVQQHVDRHFSVMLILHTAVGEQYSIVFRAGSPDEIEKASVLLDGRKVGRIGSDLFGAAYQQIGFESRKALWGAGHQQQLGPAERELTLNLKHNTGCSP